MDDSQIPRGSALPLLITAEKAGVITTLGEPCEPFGELSFFKMTDVFYDKAYALDEEGCEFFLLEDMTSLAEIRAATFACRRLEKPIVAVLDAKDEDIETMGGAELAFLISLQNIGVSALCVRCADSEHLNELFTQLYPYSRIPLMAKLYAGNVKVQDLRKLISSGVDMFDCREISQAEMQVAAVELRRIGERAQKEDISFVAANEEQAFFLSPESMTFSPLIDIECDMATELVDLEDESYDCISIIITEFDDGFRFSQNMHYLSRPIMFTTENPEALRMALQYYNGRALVDSKCGIDEETLESIANDMGTIIY